MVVGQQNNEINFVNSLPDIFTSTLLLFDVKIILMKKLLGILVVSLLFISNSYATHFLTKKARAVCKVNQDIDLIMNWKHDDGSWEVEEFRLKKGDHLKMHFHKNNSGKWYVGSDGEIFPLKNTDWDRVEVSKKYEGTKIKDIIGSCKKIKYIKYKSHTANSFNEIFNKKYSSKSVKLNGELYLGGQDHFYLEGQISLTIPKEDNNNQIFFNISTDYNLYGNIISFKLINYKHNEYIKADIDDKELKEIQDIAWHAFSSIGCKDWGRVDFMQDEQNNFQIIEVNTVPGLTETSLYPKAASFEGISFADLVGEILLLACKDS